MVRPDVAPPQGRVRWGDIVGKPDFSDVATLEAEDSLGNVKTNVNKIVDKMKTAVIVLMCGLSTALSALAATTLNGLPGTAEFYTAAETDAAIIRLAPAPGNYLAVSNAAMNAATPSITNGLVTASITNGLASTDYVDGATNDLDRVMRDDMARKVDIDNGKATNLVVFGKLIVKTGSTNYSAVEINGGKATWNAIAINSGALANNPRSFVWKGSGSESEYASHGNGTFNVDPNNGVNGLYIGETNFADHVRNIAGTFTTNRYPLFVIDLNPGEARVWQHIELKATTNNFENDSLVFYGASTDNEDANSLVEHDWFRLFVLSKRADSDVRKWTRISRTGDIAGYAPLALAVLVDTGDANSFRRGPGRRFAVHDRDPNLVWSYVRIDSSAPETDQDGRSCWRPVMPVKWYAELPDWATNDCSTVDASGIEPYVDPWIEAIDSADTSYQRFETLTNVNQSVQYVTNAANNTLAITIPTGLYRSKDWVVYCFFGAETSITLPAATWWMADAAYTNAIPANQPTALYFTQVTDGVYMLSRQELTPVLIQTGE